jgi:hypothetical protein
MIWPRILVMVDAAVDVTGHGCGLDDPILCLGAGCGESNGEWCGDQQKKFHENSLSRARLSLPNAPREMSLHEAALAGRS